MGIVSWWTYLSLGALRDNFRENVDCQMRMIENVLQFFLNETFICSFQVYLLSIPAAGTAIGIKIRNYEAIPPFKEWWETDTYKHHYNVVWQVLK